MSSPRSKRSLIELECLHLDLKQDYGQKIRINGFKSVEPLNIKDFGQRKKPKVAASVVDGQARSVRDCREIEMLSQYFFREL